MTIAGKESNLWSDYLGKKLLLIALILVLLTHGIIIYFTLPKTYDAYVHLFFADHYKRFWFEPWEYRWYTGFLTISYPPLVHQMMALLAKLFPLKVAFCIYAIFIYEVLIVGIYRFSKIFFDKTTAGIAAILAVLLSSMVETLHVYGQLPTLNGLAFLLNALPFLYHYFRNGGKIYLFLALSFLAVTISAHHVTAIFGMVFFIAPTIFMALSDDIKNSPKLKGLFPFLLALVSSAFKKYGRFILFGILMLTLMIGLIFPYWYWSKTDPITQVSIPHGSRDNFLQNTASGLMFYVIPLSLVLALLPAIASIILSKRRYLAWAIAFFLCILLGSGGTTPLPKLLLGDNAFNILTLDRFGFWASIIAIPFMAKFIHSFFSGAVYEFWIKKFGKRSHFLFSGLTGFSYLLFIIFIFHLSSFRPLQPKEVDIEPILNFLNRDEHMRWRYLTLGFGDQMAWLSSNTLAATVDGNYHSARRLPELTTRPIERLENAKFSGDEGLASLTDFLKNAESFSLKYVFSNDRYYDPLLYFLGWNRTIRLENGIMVWEKGNISTIKPLKPKKISPLLTKMWGILPCMSLIIAIISTFIYLKRFKNDEQILEHGPDQDHYPPAVTLLSSFLPLLMFSSFIGTRVYELLLVNEQGTPKNTVLNLYQHLDFQRFEKAYGFFEPKPTFTIDQYLLQKSVNDGGLLPSFAKLDSISIKEIKSVPDTVSIDVASRWRTSLGFRYKKERLRLLKREHQWYVIPEDFAAEIPEEQTLTYNYTLFKKVGKRVISSFPTVKDDRVKKPFAAFKQVNLVQHLGKKYITGEILNADDIPIHMALKVIVYPKGKKQLTFYPSTNFIYNLSPKASSTFNIELGDTFGTIDKIEVFLDTDVSERGYLHGGTSSIEILKDETTNFKAAFSMSNELTTEVTIPGVLVAERDVNGRILQNRLLIFDTAIRSGLRRTFNFNFKKIGSTATFIKNVPINVHINGSKREVLPLTKGDLTSIGGLSIQNHCFLGQEIYLQ